MKEIFSGDTSAEVQHIGESVSVEDIMNSAFLETPLEWLREENFEKLTNQIDSMNFLSDEQKQEFKEKAAKASNAKIVNSLVFTKNKEELKVEEESKIIELVNELSNSPEIYENAKFIKFLNVVNKIVMNKLVFVNEEIESYSQKTSNMVEDPNYIEKVKTLMDRDDVLRALSLSIITAEIEIEDPEH